MQPHKMPDGIELSIIDGSVPVLGLDKASMLDEYASWLLQIAARSEGKASSLYDYIHDDRILARCRSLGLSTHEVGIAQMKRKGMEHIKAVGTCGKRSIMISLVIALVINNEADIESIRKAVLGYQAELETPIMRLLHGAAELSGKKLSKRHARRDEFDDNEGAKSNGKRKRSEDLGCSSQSRIPKDKKSSDTQEVTRPGSKKKKKNKNLTHLTTS